MLVYHATFWERNFRQILRGMGWHQMWDTNIVCVNSCPGPIGMPTISICKMSQFKSQKVARYANKIYCGNIWMIEVGKTKTEKVV